METVLFAHEGGWDEALLVLGPLLLIGALLWLANKRVNSKLTDLQADQAESGQKGQNLKKPKA